MMLDAVHPSGRGNQAPVAKPLEMKVMEHDECCLCKWKGGGIRGHLASAAVALCQRYDAIRPDREVAPLLAFHYPPAD